MIILREYNRTEHDDWILNVQPKLRDNQESIDIVIAGKLVGWKIQYQFE